MVTLNDPALQRIVGSLRKYDSKSTVTKLAGLLIVPRLQANAMRLETLVHLAVAHCQGRRDPGLAEISRWLNKRLLNTQIVHLEDPAEDVFITNVRTPEGNRRVFEGIWESNDYFAQIVIDILGDSRMPQECRALPVPVFALLALSDHVAQRVGLQRWQCLPSTPGGSIELPSATQMSDRARAVTFTTDDLGVLGINRDILEPFILPEEDKQAIASETTEDSSLERHPLVDFGGDLVLTLPSAISPAIRRFVLTELRRMGHLQAFHEALATRQARQVDRDGLREIKGESDSLNLPAPDSNIPSLHAWLLKYDMDKYLHVVLLHDRMDWLDSQGLSSFMRYPEKLRAGLENYLSQISSHCRSLPGFVEGITLLIMGGLGRGFALGFEDWPNQWRLSVIRISNLLMLAGEVDRPLARYLKCIKQKEWAEEKGVSFQNMNGDYNFYCYWRHQNYQLVPREFQLSPKSGLFIANDFVSPVREEVRKLVDCHVLETTAGSYVPVKRLHSGTYFKSMQGRPTYASLAHLDQGILAGAVETPRGPSWFSVKPLKGGEDVRSFLYRVWGGFIGLFDKLVFEIETFYPTARAGSIEIRLNFDEVVLPENSEELRVGETSSEPEVAVDFNRRTAEVKLPPYFIRYFQQPENTGESLVLRSIAKGLVRLHQEETDDIEESVSDTLVQSVLDDSGMRVLHVFQTHYPIERLLARKDRDPIFLAHEDLNFFKLGLSGGCTSVSSGANIVSKAECNTFLHKVVDKIWDRVRKRLHRLDRASVLREVLKVHEAAIQDRGHWRQTAQSVLALYTPTDDVHAIAQELDSERSRVSLAARTVLEMAICECPESGGRQLSRWELDELLAEAALLIEVATDSDAVNNDLTKPKIKLHANGDYTLDRSFHDTMMRPFLTAYFHEEFESAAGKYSELYRNKPPGERKRLDEMFSSEFITAFRVEFGLTSDDAMNGVGELMDLAVECNDLVVETTLDAIKDRLTSNRNLTPDDCKAFFRAFSIFHRPAWDSPPSGFKHRDLYPWRFSRRLSVTTKPILALGEQDHDKVLFGAGTLRRGFQYLLGKIENGHLPQEFFRSREMKRYIGKVNDEKGHAFARSVADQMRKDGWKARIEVQMTELGGLSELGDIDVLAWKPSGEIRLIECKRLQFARTVAEVAEICRRFRGEAKDELDKHVQRKNWVRANTSGLQPIVGFVPDQARLDDRLVTNTHVPMTYLKSLPIKANKIGPLKVPRQKDRGLS